MQELYRKQAKKFLIKNYKMQHNDIGRMTISSNSNQVAWLHISDFHFKSETTYDQDIVLKNLINSLPDLVRRYGYPDFVIASGDIAYSGKSSEYKIASIFFDRILNILNLEKDRLFVVPGNHDVDRNKGKGLARTLSSANEADEYFSDSAPLLHISHRMNDFSEWYDLYFKDIRTFPKNTTVSIETLCVNDINVTIGLFNSAVFSFDEKDSGSLFIGRRCIDSAISKIEAMPKGLKIAVKHHPFNWLNSIEMSQVKSRIFDNFDCVLTGHMHENEIENIIGSFGDAIALSAGASYQTTKWPNTALICKLHNNDLNVIPIRFVESPRAAWTLDTSLFHKKDDYTESYTLKIGNFDECVNFSQSNGKELATFGESWLLPTANEASDVVEARLKAYRPAVYHAEWRDSLLRAALNASNPNGNARCWR